MFEKVKPVFRAAFSSRLWVLYGIALAAGLAVMVWMVAPVQIPVVIYKIALALGAGLAGYGLDRALFPYAHPAGYLADDWRKQPDADLEGNADYPVVHEYRWPFIAATLRQAAVVCVCMLAVCLGL